MESPHFDEGVEKFSSNRFEADSGACFKFVSLNEHWGFKCSPYKNRAIASYLGQKRASKLGLAPKVGPAGMFEVDGREYFGFITQRAEIVDQLLLTEAEKQTYHDDLWYEIDSWLTEDNQYCDLERALSKADFDMCDLHAGNIGYMPDGRMVCIDFDMEIHKKNMAEAVENAEW